MIRKTLAGLAAVPLLVLALGAAPAQAADNGDPKLTISDIELSTTSVAANGLKLTPIDVAVKAKYNETGTDPEQYTLVVKLARTGGTGQATRLLSVDLKRTAGTPQDGVWTGRIEVPSTANGTFKVTGVFSGRSDMYGPNPYDGQTLTVTGTHQPKFTSSSTPSPVPVNKAYKLSWRLTDSDTGKPLTKTKVTIGFDNTCAEPGGQSALTDANGSVSTQVAARNEALNCVFIESGYNIVVFGGDDTKFLVGVSAAPAKTSAKVGTVVPVNGTVTEARTCKVNLQRLYGASQWRTVGTSNIRSSGRFTLNAQPAYKGKIYYRVLMSPCSVYVAASSKSFTITGV
ncbi:hypothetical protein E1263_23290 [Kribbella antibiotica]|uniref:Uncharacterized protein n=1 Tax=Kribbella antibiotica TaxID=190195 RepID=A0A4R4ZG11_9ACTN|nr:hypothetical protein [Kribbella antibiotica]TDD57518.1 hypothetical protein E1263_23290 [Kribbella antibiotica]